MLSYRERWPTPALRPYVECYWFLNGGDAAGLHPILPDGCVELVLNLGAPFQRLGPDGRSEVQPLRMVVGQMDRLVTVCPTGGVDLVGVRFHPCGARPLLQLPMVDLRNELAPLDDVIGLGDRVSPEHRQDDRVGALDDLLLAELRDPSRRDSDLEAAVRSIVSAEGRVSVDRLAFSMGIGPRQLERRFLAGVGVGPKRFARILRFQSVFKRAGEDARAWAEVALDCGYCDQAHFIRDFQSFTGASPARFFLHESPLTRFFTRRERKSGFYNTAMEPSP